ncbi:MAG: helix-turn-helix domain-containing protein [Acidobacteriota bacterium]|nr:helix-turn-helix domain-containing protein [Acidobacteriota bacterium]
MPNIASILKDEIIRLARREVRKEVEGLKKASAHYRTEIAGLKRRVAELEKQHLRLEKKAPKKVMPEAEGEETTHYRFSAKRFAAQRQKLGVSAGAMGALLGVSAQSVYNWEAGKSRPRPPQLAEIAALRKLGKRQAHSLLANLAD